MEQLKCFTNVCEYPEYDHKSIIGAWHTTQHIPGKIQSAGTVTNLAVYIAFVIVTVLAEVLVVPKVLVYTGAVVSMAVELLVIDV